MRALLALGFILASAPRPAAAFCGFYVGKADAQLYNKASQVVLARDGDKTAISMANDYRGELKEFALVVPVPVVLKREQVNVGDRKLFERLDAYSAPRLVEYFDEDPCSPSPQAGPAAARGAMATSEYYFGGDARRAKALGVTIEASYTVGEYDILILGAKQSDGLETWLHENGYRVPKGASKALFPYIQQKMKFFVAKVNLEEQAKSGFTGLRPIQFAYEDARFMLPIRLGMINADGPQDLIVYALTRNGRVETTNYRSVRVPADTELPEYVKDEFAPFYRAMFERSVEREGGRAVFTEYFWDMGWCDPCAADPLSAEELRKLGVFWLAEAAASPAPMPGRPWRRQVMGAGAVPVLVTRLHVRYDAERFPEDLVFQETADRQNFQGRYILRHPFRGAATCESGHRYQERVKQREQDQARTLARLTGWEEADIRRKMGLGKTAPKPWYDGIFK